jgi:hypothetical protein
VQTLLQTDSIDGFERLKVEIDLLLLALVLGVLSAYIPGRSDV